MFASGSFMLSLVYALRRLHQNITVTISQSTDQQKCAEQVLHSALPLLLNTFSTAM